MSGVDRAGILGSTRLFDELLADEEDCLVWSDRGFRTHSAAGMTVHCLTRSRALLDVVYGPKEMQPRAIVLGRGREVLPTDTCASGVWRSHLGAATISVTVGWDPSLSITGWRFVWVAADLDIAQRWTAEQQEAYEDLQNRVVRLRVVFGGG